MGSPPTSFEAQEIGVSQFGQIPLGLALCHPLGEALEVVTQADGATIAQSLEEAELPLIEA
jgi:hypothetical protein